MPQGELGVVSRPGDRQAGSLGIGQRGAAEQGIQNALRAPLDSDPQVRYCFQVCQRAHWPEYKAQMPRNWQAQCALAATRRDGAAAASGHHHIMRSLSALRS